VTNMDLLDMEPDEAPAPAQAPALMEVLPPEQPDDLALRQVMPEDFPLLTLLRFIPDIALKKAVQAAAEAALAVDVTQPDGLTRADAALPPLRAAMANATASFDDPVSLANQLHKRLTGLRGDFCADGAKALETVNDRIKAEKRKRDAVDAENRRAAQAEADRKAKDDLARAAKEAAARNAPKDVVQALKQQAKVAVAPPVSVPRSAPPLQNTSVVEKWRCRLKGTPDDAEPNPEMTALTLDQQQAVRRIFKSISEGRIPLTAASLDWTYLNKRAGAEKTTFDLPDLEAFDEGGTRSKPGAGGGRKKKG
jgi:hypothetical protein